jgi:hypothetical protein
MTPPGPLAEMTVLRAQLHVLPPTPIMLDLGSTEQCVLLVAEYECDNATCVI